MVAVGLEEWTGLGKVCVLSRYKELGYWSSVTFWSSGPSHITSYSQTVFRRQFLGVGLYRRDR